MSRLSALLRRLRRHQRATALMEFALTAPVFLLLLMGIFDYCWQMYAQQVLQGAVAKAGRDATIEAYAVNQSQLDQRVQAQVQRVFRDAQLTFKRSAYDDFASIKEPIPVDCDGDGKVDYYDDGGQAGNGGADDIVKYTVSMRFDRILPVWRMLGQPQSKILTSSTVLRNQPFANGAEVVPETCS